MQLLRHEKDDISVNLEVEIPAASTERSAVGWHAEAAHSVLMTVEQRDTTALQHVPHIHDVVVVATKQQPTFVTHTRTVTSDYIYNLSLSLYYLLSQHYVLTALL